MLPRILLPERSLLRSSMIIAIALIAGGVFVYEGLVGRRERHKMLKRDREA